MKDSELLDLGIEEIEVLQQVAAIWKRLSQVAPPVFFDVGSRFGAVSARLAQVIDMRQIHAFEPQVQLHPQIQRALSNTLVPFTIEAVACGATPGRSYLYQNVDSGTSSLLPPTQELRRLSPHYECVAAIEVTTVTLDDYVAGGNPSPDILKIDTQGYDLEVLRGSTEMLERQQPSIILTEAYVASAYVGAPSFFDIGIFLKQYNYELFNIPRTVLTRKGQVYFLDAIFVPERVINALEEVDDAK